MTCGNRRGKRVTVEHPESLPELAEHRATLYQIAIMKQMGWFWPNTCSYCETVYVEMQFAAWCEHYHDTGEKLVITE